MRKMQFNPLFFFFALFIFFESQHALRVPFNSSRYLSLSPSLDLPPISSPPILKEVVETIAEKERWDSRGEVRVSSAVRTTKIGASQKYEFHVRVKKTLLVVKFYDEEVAWRRFESDSTEFEYELSPVKPLVLDGPLDLLINSRDDDISLKLPALNSTQKGLRRVLVGDGITITINDAQEVVLYHPHNIGPLLNGSIHAHSKGRTQFHHIGHGSCAPVTSVRLTGSTSVVASKTHNPQAYMETTLLSHDTVKLLADKCFSQGNSKEIRTCMFCSHSSRLASLEGAFKSLLGYNVFRSSYTRLLKAKISSSTLVEFYLELERNITEHDTRWRREADWKTRPTVERVWYEVLARVNSGRALTPVAVKKLKRPRIIVESTAWSNLMSNMSFTEFSSFLVPPEALTLDVKW